MVFKKGHEQSNSGKTHFKKGHIPWSKGKKIWDNKNHPKGMLGKESWNKGKKLSEEHKRNLRLAWKKRRKKPNYRNFLKKISETGYKKGEGYWLGKKREKETKKKISISNKGKHHSPITEFRKGNKLCEIFIKKGIDNNPMRGETHWCWKGGITPKNEKIRKSKKYQDWRKAVFERDNYTCVWCGKVGEILNADHIKPFSLFPELRFSIDNGRTLCESCHKKTDTYGRKSHKK